MSDVKPKKKVVFKFDEKELNEMQKIGPYAGMVDGKPITPPVLNEFVEIGCEQFGQKKPVPSDSPMRLAMIDDLKELKQQLATLRTQLKSVEGNCAVMREAINSFFASITPDSDNYVGGVCELQLSQSVSGDAGKSLLDKLSGYEKRLVEAKDLLENAECIGVCGTMQWFSRRDAWLKGVVK